MILYIGSIALNAVSNIQTGALVRRANDIDVIASFEDGIAYLKDQGCKFIEPTHEGAKLHGIKELRHGTKIHYEVEIAWEGSSAAALMDLVWADSVPVMGTVDQRFAPVNALYALKMSHRYRKNSPHFAKTMTDIHSLRALGASISPELMDWYKQRERETYAYSHPKLNTTRKQFFAGDGIDYVYDHDTIHLTVMRRDRPAYDFFKPDTAEVFCSKDMFFSESEEVRLNAVYEESCVLALERSIIPHPGALTPEKAFAKALEKVCTSITSGWFREYAWENHRFAMELYDRETIAGRNYVTLFEAGLKNGTVKPHKAADNEVA